MTAGNIVIDGIEKRFGAVVAVAPTSLEIAGGEFFSLLGPSGCGKTTLLRVLGGLEKPDRGRISVDGTDVTRLPSYRRPTNMVFQSYAIFPHLTVGENIAYGLVRRKLTPAERARAVGEMLEMIHLDGYGDRRPDQLSGGQMQRVALARALVLKPKVLLLDEPLAALDKKLRENMQIELRRLQREVGITFILVTHDQEEALTLSDRIAVMKSGRIMQCSSPRDLYERPISRDIAEFVGEMNFLSARVVNASGVTIELDVGGIGRVALPSTLSVRRGDAVTLALRPERFHLAPPSDGAPVFEVRGCTYFGNRTLYELAGTGLSTPISVLDSVRSDSEATLGIGTRVGLCPDFAAAVLLPDTGSNLSIQGATP